MGKKVTFKGFCALHRISTKMKLSLGASMNEGDYFDTSKITCTFTYSAVGFGLTGL
jgi:hypothetical protein